MSAKRDRERVLLDAVYAPDEFADVDHQDRPDFVIQRHHRSSESFGVEVTELFETESDARVRARPEYVSTLLEGGRPMHRDDEKILSVSRVRITSKDGELKAENVPAILRQLPPAEQHYDALAERILAKGQKFDGYRSDLTHVNLIVADRFGPAPEVNDEGDYPTGRVLTERLRDALVQTPFQEVFLVSTNGQHKQFYRPLQQLLLLRTFFTFGRACDAFNEEQQAGIHLEHLVPLFLAVHEDSDLTLRPVQPWGGGTVAAQYRGSAVRVGSGAGAEILDHRDGPASPLVAAPPHGFSPSLLADLKTHYLAFQARTEFTVGLALNLQDER